MAREADWSDAAVVARLMGWSHARAAAALRRHGSLHRFCDSVPRDDHSRARLEAALELGRRVLTAPLPRGRPIRSPEDVAAHFRPLLRREKRERFFALLLDSAHRLIRPVEISIGTLDSAPVVPREALCEAVRESAAAILFAHNHPSGDPTPSSEDRAVTVQLRMACEILGIRFLDHVVVGDPGWASVK